MWQTASQRVRALSQARKRARDRKRKGLHLRRVMGQLKIQRGLGEAPITNQVRVLLNDLTPKGLGLFSSTPMMPGQEVSLTIEEPRRFYVRARIVWCQECNGDTKVISQERYVYRVGVEFVFENDEERAEVDSYCKELLAKYVNDGEAA